MDASPKLDGVAIKAVPKSLSSPNPTLSTDSPSIKWHELHCDPLMDIVIVSKDGVYFRASSHALKRESAFFKGMLSIPTPHQSSFDALTLDFPADVIEIFLDIYTSGTGRPIYKVFPLASLAGLRRLMQYLDCDRFLTWVNQSIYDACRSEPIEWLVWASEENDTSSAMAALRRCQEIRAGHLTHHNVFGIVERIRRTWRYPLLKCVLYWNAYDDDSSFRLGWVGNCKAIGERLYVFSQEVRLAESELGSK